MELDAACNLIQVTTTMETKEDAERMADHLVRERLVACAQVGGPITSYYWWKDRLETAVEWECRAKTPAENYPAVEEAIRSRHTYEVPQIVALPVVAALPAYQKWIRDVTAT
jgi:periplasmic divalent cation tolerance protein